MGRRGPPPKPTALRVIQGNPSKRPMPKHEAKPRLGIPEMPDHLDEVAAGEWRRVADELYRIGLLAEIDGSMLAAYCAAYSRWRSAEQVLHDMASKDPTTSALLLRGREGNPVKNPVVAVANQALAVMMRAAGEFGMTPSARARIAAAKQEIKGEDPGEAFFRDIG